VGQANRRKRRRMRLNAASPAFVALLHVLDPFSPSSTLHICRPHPYHHSPLRAQSPYSTVHIALAKQRCSPIPSESRLSPPHAATSTSHATAPAIAAIACSGLPPTEGGDGPQGKAEDQHRAQSRSCAPMHMSCHAAVASSVCLKRFRLTHCSPASRQPEEWA
jgi:hypothetical protein